MNDLKLMRLEDICACFERLKMKKITQKEAALILNLSERQSKRKYKRYLERGILGLVHKGIGKESNRRLDAY